MKTLSYWIARLDAFLAITLVAQSFGFIASSIENGVSVTVRSVLIGLTDIQLYNFGAFISISLIWALLSLGNFDIDLTKDNWMRSGLALVIASVLVVLVAITMKDFLSSNIKLWLSNYDLVTAQVEENNEEATDAMVSIQTEIQGKIHAYYEVINTAETDQQYSSAWNFLTAGFRNNHSLDEFLSFWGGDQNNPRGLRAAYDLYKCDQPVAIDVDEIYYYRDDRSYTDPIGSHSWIRMTLDQKNDLIPSSSNESNCEFIGRYFTGITEDQSKSIRFSNALPGILIILLLLSLSFGILYAARTKQAELPNLVVKNEWINNRDKVAITVLTIINQTITRKVSGIARDVTARLVFFDLDDKEIMRIEHGFWWNTKQNPFPALEHKLSEIQPVDIHPNEQVNLIVSYIMLGSEKFYAYEYASSDEIIEAQSRRDLGNKAVKLQVILEGGNIRSKSFKFLLKREDAGIGAHPI